MSDTSKTILQTVISQLKADATLTGLVGTRIYTHVPQQKQFPYVFISINSTAEDTYDLTGTLHTLRIQMFSQEWGIETSLDIKEAIYNVLQRNENFDFSLFAGVESSFIEDDNRTQQRVLEFTIN